MDESAEVRIMTGSSGVIKLEIYYPGALTGSEISTISLNGEPVRDAGEQRGEKRFSMIVNFTAD